MFPFTKLSWPLQIRSVSLPETLGTERSKSATTASGRSRVGFSPCGSPNGAMPFASLEPDTDAKERLFMKRKINFICQLDFIRCHCLNFSVKFFNMY